MQDSVIKCVGVVGAGAMGAGIAQVSAMAGMAVRLYDTREQAAGDAINKIHAWFDKRVSDGKLDEATRSRYVSCLSVASTLDDLASCDLVIEAIIENAQAKKDLFNALEAVVADSAILASNTSSIPIGVLAAGCRAPGRVAGLHFFNPVPLMRLVEIIAAPRTDKPVLAALAAYVKALGKTAVHVKDMPGFLVNFGGRAYPTEGLAIVHEGVATPAQVDDIMRDCYGFRMGPFELMDLTGIDVNFPVTELVHQSFFGDPRLRSTPLHRYLLATGQLGRKSGRGFYDYTQGSAHPVVDDAVTVPASDLPCQMVIVDRADTVLCELLSQVGVAMCSDDDGVSPYIVALQGEDCSAWASRKGVDYRRVVAIDTLGDTGKRVTLMAAPGHDPACVKSVAALFRPSRSVTLINDSMGFVGQRIVAMVANLGCDMAQTRLATPEDIDLAMKLGLNYPQGPLEMVDSFGAGTLYTMLQTMQALSGDDRYRPSPWLRRCAQLGLPARHQ